MKLINKTLIAAATVSTTIGVAFLGAFAFSRTSEQIIGGVNQTKLQLTDLFADGKDFVAFVTPADKETSIGTYDKTTNQISYNSKKWEFQDFFDQFIKDNEGATPIMRVSKNGLNFFNEYLEAVPPKDFIEYVDWFVENVAWGPEALTLKSFSIVRNISRKGSTVTLGGHETKTKETKTIKFYPDSFFGSLPLFDTSAGPSNAVDRLLHPLNTKLLDQEQLNDFLSNIDRFNILANDKTENKDRITFRNLSFAHFLKGKKVFHFVLPNGQTFFVYGKNKVEAFQKVVKFNQNQVDFNNRVPQDINLLEESTFTDVSLSNGSLVLKFGENGSKQATIRAKDFAYTTQYSLDDLEALTMLEIQNFRDIYNIGQYQNDEYYLYDMGSGKNSKIFASILKAKEDLAAKYDETKIQKVTLSKVETKEQKLTLEFSNDKKEIVKTFNFDANDNSQETFEFFFLLKRAFGYKATVSPFVVRSESEELDRETLATKKLYKVYNEYYQDLIETVLYKYPYLRRSLDGEHLVKYVDENGSYQYKMETGSYHGLDLSDRIPFLMLVAATSKDFKGVGIDFLKYVGAHEYGHHTTLQNIQNVGDGNTPILLGSLSPNSSPKDNQYYNASVLKEYLKARSKSLDFEQNDIDENSGEQNDGAYISFKWKDSNTDTEINESKEDIWGSANKSVTETIENKRRRFVQDIEGLKEAARLRGMTLSELFLMNTLDNNSATLNPRISGRAQFMETNGDFDFTSYAKLFNSLTDGQNNPIKFKETPFNIWPIDPIIIEYEDDNETVKAVKVFTVNGEPVINVKPGEKLNEQQKALENSIKSNMLSLLTSNFGSSGWNKSNTNLDIKSEITTDYIGPLKGSGKPISEKNRSVQKNVDWLKKYFENRDLEDGDIDLEDDEKIAKGNINLYLNIPETNNLPNNNRNRSRLSTQIISILGVEYPFLRVDKYVMRFVSNLESYFVDSTKNLAPKSGRDKMPIDLFDTFTHRFPFSQKIVNDNPAKPLIFRLLDKENRPTNVINGPSLRNSKEIIAVDPFKLELLDNPFDSSVFESYLDSSLVDYKASLEKADGTKEMKIVKTLGFSKLEDLIEFSSIDLTKILVGKKIVDGVEITYRIFDMDYVKTKFDIEKFKTKYAAWVNSLSQHSEKAKSELLKKIATDQDAANEVMERFLKGSLQFMIKNSFVTENLSNIEAAVNEEIGIGVFKESGVVASAKPNRDNNEINAKDLYDTMQSFLKLNNITIQNQYVSAKLSHSLTTFDVLMLTGKLIFQAGVPSKKGTVLGNEFLAVYFKKWGPSDDVSNYINNPIETQLSGIFSEYTYTIPEVLTRDFVQISYALGNEDYRTLPSYLKGANESNTGNEFYLTSSETVVWSESLNSPNLISKVVIAISNSFSAELVARKNAEFEQNIVDKDAKIILLRKELADLEKEKVDSRKKLEDAAKENTDLLTEKQNEIRDANANVASLTNLWRDLRFISHGGKRVLRGILNNKSALDDYQTNMLPLLEGEGKRLEKKVIEKNAKIKENKEIIANIHSTTDQVEKAKEEIKKIRSELKEIESDIFSNNWRILSINTIIKKYEEDLQFFENLTNEQINEKTTSYLKSLIEYREKVKEFEKIIPELIKKAQETTNAINENEEKINEKIFNKNKEIENAIKSIKSELPKEDNFELNTLAIENNHDYNDEKNYVSSFFGNVNKLNNGYFFDRWLRKELDWGIYDDKGESIQDKDIRITDLKGEKVTDRARASWIYLLKSKGVSLGTLTGNWRDKDRDANVFWGYVPIELGNQIKFLVFEDTETGKKVYLDIKVEGTNNLFYYKKAGDKSTKVTLVDEGYVSWTTNYSFIARYKNALILPNRSYKVYFADENKSLVEGLSLKENTKLLGENNKTISQSPTYFFKKQDQDDDNVYFFVQNQFNI